jgi:membrane-associated phospholipid phosphatase
MRFFTFLGSAEFYLLLIAFLYWCVDAGWGMQALFLVLTSDFVNGLVKWAFHGPRPFWIDTRVKALTTETSYGIPSGHAQTGTALWGLLAATLKKERGTAWAPVAAAALILAISISRVYLGVHFPHDAVGGWVIGVLLLAAFFWIQPRLTRWRQRRPLVAQIGAVLILSVAMLGLVLGAHRHLSAFADPPSWETQAASAAPPAPGRPATDTRSPESFFRDVGTLFGAAAGLALMRRYAPFDPRGPWGIRLLRLVLGLVVVMGLRVGLGVLGPREPSAATMFTSSARYALISLWVVWLAPWAFLKVGLAARVQSPG